VLVRTSDEMKKIVNENPFLDEKGIDRLKLHVTFLSDLPAKSSLTKLDALSSLPDRYRVKCREVYLHCPNGYGKTKLSNNVLERLLSVEATTRNWSTVNKLVEISAEKA